VTDRSDPEAAANPRLVVIGHGMVGHRLLEELVAVGAHDRWSITVFGEEPVMAYDRVRLSAVFDGADPDELSMVAPGFVKDHGIDVVVGDEVVSVDRGRRTVTTAGGRVEPYDHLVLATGSAPFVPPVPGAGRPGTFVYRTLDDLAAIRAHAERPWVRTGVVIGGGLLGLEAANALRLLGLETHVVEMAPRLMPAQLDEGAAALLRRAVEHLGIRVHSVNPGFVSTEFLARADHQHPQEGEAPTSPGSDPAVVATAIRRELESGSGRTVAVPRYMGLGRLLQLPGVTHVFDVVARSAAGRLAGFGRHMARTHRAA